MNTGVIVLWTFAVVLGLFGLAFVWTGLNGERGYWSQRDPHGNARNDATKFPTILRNAFTYAVGEVRAPLRIAAIGVILIYAAVAFAVVAVIVSLLNS
ncbi:MAG: hypothetical protein PHN51_00145 [Candidatus Nanopelagicales bacterium]|nr:hypothetical protein [Candidatus Nanopelagicales bacterium]